VAKIHLSGQTSTIPTTTMVTPKKNGLYRISAYGAITVPGKGCNEFWNLILGWTDDAGTEQTPILVPPLILQCNWAPPGGNITIILAVSDEPGMPLTYRVATAGGDPISSSYELFITVEQLM
jgi:hypothetical protein